TTHIKGIDGYHQGVSSVVKEVAALPKSRCVTECVCTSASFAFAQLSPFEETLYAHAQEMGKDIKTIEEWKAFYRKKVQESHSILNIDTPLHPCFLQ
ncbi:hypothetical protein OAN21_01565, partial [Alphaproteobacteria bacterium]|nr:hypothetical protein [Alphaproteobacteria bacterium]